MKKGLAKNEAQAAEKADITPPSQAIASNVDQDVNLHRDGFRGTAGTLTEAGKGAAYEQKEAIKAGTYSSGHGLFHLTTYRSRSDGST